jgi:hypothetical protein
MRSRLRRQALPCPPCPAPHPSDSAFALENADGHSWRTAHTVGTGCVRFPFKSQQSGRARFDLHSHLTFILPAPASLPRHGPTASTPLHCSLVRWSPPQANFTRFQKDQRNPPARSTPFFPLIVSVYAPGSRATRAADRWDHREPGPVCHRRTTAIRCACRNAPGEGTARSGSCAGRLPLPRPRARRSRKSASKRREAVRAPAASLVRPGGRRPELALAVIPFGPTRQTPEQKSRPRAVHSTLTLPHSLSPPTRPLHPRCLRPPRAPTDDDRSRRAVPCRRRPPRPPT